MDGGSAGLRFQPGMTVDFASPETGFAWNSNATGVAPIYATTNGGRTWTSISRGLRGPAGPPVRAHRCGSSQRR